MENQIYQYNSKWQYQFFASIKIGEWIYFSAWNTNGLFKTNIENGETVFLKTFSEENGIENLHFLAFYNQGNIWFIPGQGGEKISKVNLQNLEIEYIELPKEKVKCQTAKFASYIYKKPNLWLIPSGYEGIIKINIETKNIEKIDFILDYINCMEDINLKFCDGVIVKDKLYMCPAESKSFVIYDLVSEQMSYLDWNYPKRAFCKMFLIENELWFISTGKHPYVEKYNLITQKVNKIELNVQESKWIWSGYGSAILWNNMIWMLPFEAQELLLINIKTCAIEHKKLHFDDENLIKEGILRYQVATPYNDRVVFLSDRLGMPMILVCRDNMMRYMRLEAPFDVKMRCSIQQIKELSIQRRNEYKDGIQYGEVIYNYIKNGC